MLFTMLASLCLPFIVSHSCALHAFHNAGLSLSVIVNKRSLEYCWQIMHKLWSNTGGSRVKDIMVSAFNQKHTKKQKLLHMLYWKVFNFSTIHTYITTGLSIFIRLSVASLLFRTAMQNYTYIIVDTKLWLLFSIRAVTFQVLVRVRK